MQVPEDELYRLRLVIQQIGVNKPPYRLVVYGDMINPRLSDFCGLEDLLATLRAAIPGFAQSNLSLNPSVEGKGSIIFAGDVRMSPSQLSVLTLM